MQTLFLSTQVSSLRMQTKLANTYIYNIMILASKIIQKATRSQFSMNSLNMEQYGIEEQVSISINNYEPMTNSELESYYEKLDDFSMNGMVRLREKGGNNSEYGMIKRSFVKGVTFLEREIDVVDIHKNLYPSLRGQARMEAFQIFSKAVAERRGGDANVKYAWYGSDRDEILDIVAHGFGGLKNFQNGLDFGSGVILTPVNVPNESALRAVEDENGTRHMLVCRVILGNTESICTGSTQFQPTSTDFDSGVDNVLSPTKYLVWRAHMNSHIFPNYLVKFKTSVLPNQPKNGTSGMVNLPRMAIMLKELAKVTKPSNMSIILHYYNFFQEKKIDRRQFIQRLRSLAGDEHLVYVVNLCRHQM